MADDKNSQGKGAAKKFVEKLMGEELKGEAGAQQKEEANENVKIGTEGEELAEEFAKLNERLMRVSAEYDNFRKRTMKEKEEMKDNMKANMLLKIIPIYEEVEMAADAAEKSNDLALANGVRMLEVKFLKMLSDEGIARMDALGKKFDPYLHEAAVHVESEKPEGEIVQVIKNGYSLNGKVIRHAVVAVAKGKEGEKKDKGKVQEEECPTC